MDKPGDAKYGMTEQQMIDSYKKLMQKGARSSASMPSCLQHHLGRLLPGAGRHPVPAGCPGQQATGAQHQLHNLSGGVGIPYRPEQTENDIMAIGEGVRKKFEEILVPAGMGDVAIFSEMGRFTTAPTAHWWLTVIHEKHIYKGVHRSGCLRRKPDAPAMYGAYHHITVLGRRTSPCDPSTTWWAAVRE